MEKPKAGEAVLILKLRMEGLLRAYNLCKTSVAGQTTLKDHVCEGIFKAGMCEYFRQYQGNEWRQRLLQKLEDPEEGTRILMNQGMEVGDWTINSLGERLKEIFGEQEEIWNKDVIGNRNGYGWVGPPVWLEVPRNVGFERTGDGIPCIAGGSGGVSAPEKKIEFMRLIEASINMEWAECTKRVRREEVEQWLSWRDED